MGEKCIKNINSRVRIQECGKIHWYFCAWNLRTRIFATNRTVLGTQEGTRLCGRRESVCYNLSLPVERRYRLGVRTEDSQSSNPGSIPGSAAIFPCNFALAEVPRYARDFYRGLSLPDKLRLKLSALTWALLQRMRKTGLVRPFRYKLLGKRPLPK